MRFRFIPAGSPSGPGRPDGRPSRPRIAAAAATVAAVAGVAAAATASPGYAATSTPSAPSAPGGLGSLSTTGIQGTSGSRAAGSRAKPAAARAKPAAVLADPALAGTGPLAAPAIGRSAPLAAPAVGGASQAASPLAGTAAPVRPRTRPAAQTRPARPAQPSASPAATDPAAPATAGPGQRSPGTGRSGRAQQAAPRRPYNFYDSVTPSAIPAGQIAATYATGPFAVSPAQVAGRPEVLWIDTNGTDPRASVLDVEPGDATPSMAASWAYRKLHADPNSLACIYTMISEWPATRAAIAALPAPMRSHIRWWIADPTGYRHIVPGSDATQWYWGSSYDISTAKSGL